MFAPNTTGLPDTGDYVLGRGKVYLAEINDVTGKPDTNGWRDVGNVPGFSISRESESLEHFSSREGTKTLDKEVVLSTKATLSFNVDEINAENVADWLSGEKSTHTNAAIAGIAERELCADVVLGRWYDIENAAGERAYDIDTADLTVEKQGAPDVLLVEGTDYTLDLKWGRIFFKHTAVNIAAGDAADITLVADAAAAVVTEVRGLTQTTRQVALKFIAINPANNDEECEIQFHQVNLKADGEFALIGEEFATMAFTAAIESNELADADSPYIRIRTHANA